MSGRQDSNVELQRSELDNQEETKNYRVSDDIGPDLSVP
jgi:hypothetical protein